MARALAARELDIIGQNLHRYKTLPIHPANAYIDYLWEMLPVVLQKQREMVE